MGVVSLTISTDDDERTVDLPVIELVLSERNLKTLLYSIDDENNTVSRMTESGMLLQIRSEPNDVHYKDRPAGLMDPDVETKLLKDEFGADETLFVPPDFGTKLDD